MKRLFKSYPTQSHNIPSNPTIISLLLYIYIISTQLAVKDQHNYMRCNWSPFVNKTFRYNVDTTIVSGQLAWHQSQLFLNCQGQALEINR